MAVCAACGRESPDDFGFCPGCGATLAPPVSRRDVRKVVTVLFCDLTGSTAIGDSTDPEPLRALMSRYYDSARAVLERHGGTVEKFVGDAVMAVFGIPVATEHDALRAVRAAVELRDGVHALGLEARIGVNTGEVVAGEGDTLVTGDAVNVAARLEQAAGPGEVLLGAETVRLVRDAVETEPVELTVKGKPEPVRGLAPPAAGRRRARARPPPRPAARRPGARARAAARRLRRCGGGPDLPPLHADRAGRRRQVAARGGLPGARRRLGDGGPRAAASPTARASRTGRSSRSCCSSAATPSRRSGRRPRTRSWPRGRCSRRSRRSGRSCSSSTTCNGPRRRCSTSSTTSPTGRARRRSSCSASPGRSCSTRDRAGAAASSTRPRSCSSRSPRSRRPRWRTTLLAGVAVDAGTRDRILATAEGNPLFLEEMAALARESRGAVDVPPTIQALLQARLDTLDASDRAVIERGAVEGKVFHRGAVTALAPAPLRDDVPTRLLSLVRRELVRPDRSQLPGDDAFRFRHLLIRDAAYESLPKASRAELHERFADWLDEHGGLVEQDEIVGYHLEQASRHRRELDAGRPPRRAPRPPRRGAARRRRLRGLRTSRPPRDAEPPRARGRAAAGGRRPPRPASRSRRGADRGRRARAHRGLRRRARAGKRRGPCRRLRAPGDLGSARDPRCPRSGQRARRGAGRPRRSRRRPRRGALRAGARRRRLGSRPRGPAHDAYQRAYDAMRRAGSTASERQLVTQLMITAVFKGTHVDELERLRDEFAAGARRGPLFDATMAAMRARHGYLAGAVPYEELEAATRRSRGSCTRPDPCTPR